MMLFLATIERATFIHAIHNISKIGLISSTGRAKDRKTINFANACGFRPDFLY